MLPYHDENETQRTAVVTIALIATNVVVWLGVQGAGLSDALVTSICDFGLIPAALTGAVASGTQVPVGPGTVCGVSGPVFQTWHVVASMFLHASWMHLLGNMWFLWLFGNNIEDSMTRGRFAAFFLLCGIAAAALQVIADPDSVIPMVGASGAISGVMGAYLVLYPRVRVFTLVPLGFFITTVALPAWVMLLYWAGLQLLSGLATLTDTRPGGVAFWAHFGGFLAGVLLVKVFERPERAAAHGARSWHPRQPGW